MKINWAEIEWESDNFQVTLTAVDKNSKIPLPKINPLVATVFGAYGSSQLRVIQAIGNLLGSDPFYLVLWHKSENHVNAVVPVTGFRQGENSSHINYVKELGGMFSTQPYNTGVVEIYAFGADRTWWKVELSAIKAEGDEIDNLSDRSTTDTSVAKYLAESNGMRAEF